MLSRPPSEPATDGGCHAQLRSGDPAHRAETLATEIYSNQRARLLRIAKRNSLNHEDAEESLQESIIAFIDSYDPDYGAHPLAWLTLVLKRKCWERTRRERLDQRVGQEIDSTENGPGTLLELIPDPSRGPHALAELRDEIAEVAGHLAQLKPDERRALTLIAEGYSYREITALTGWTHTKINRCLAEGRARLRKLSSTLRDAGRPPNRSHQDSTTEISSSVR